MSEPPADATDALIDQLRQRAADPGRRTDAHRGIPPSGSFPGTTVMNLDLGGLFAAGPSLVQDLNRVVEANRAGRVDPGLADMMTRLDSMMSEPVEPTLPPPASAAALEEAEAELGFELPPILRRVYAEVADGGFGPAGGLLPIARMVSTYRDLRADPPGPRGQEWPQGLLPVADHEPGYLCVEAPSSRVIDWDMEELAESSSDRAWQRSFKEHAPDVETWLGTWVESRHPDEIRAEQVEESTVRQAREARAMIAAMTPEERAAMGLPEVGWERVVWGGIGLDE